MAKHARFRRVVFNFGLSLRIQMYSKDKLSDSKVLNEAKKVLTNYVKKNPEFGWMNQLSSRVYQNALIDLKDAFSRYRSGKAGHPRFASRRDGESFRVDSSNGKVFLSAGNTIKIPTLGTFRVHEPLECGYASQIEFTSGCVLIQDASKARCSGATIWIEAAFESLVIDGEVADRAMFKKGER